MGQDSGRKIAAVGQSDLEGAVSDHMGIGDDQPIRAPDGTGAAALPAAAYLHQAAPGVIRNVSHFLVQLLQQC